ncbi:hypothetical protein CXB51_019406 [Gossypium anomalum]|uniref:Uncharacterized protein n=1 Tax=Gossypium anomalum TaxID=47600 RepID=A0A8J6CWG3_9ROSI|nr:hypothetical protein CXB51_019406 [Gossypium anomalum]
MASNSKQFRPVTKPTRRVHGLSSLSLEDKIDKLTNVVQTLLSDKTGLAQLCGIFAKLDHLTGSCPILLEDSAEQANAVENFPGPPQRRSPEYQLWDESAVQSTVSTEAATESTDTNPELDKQVIKLALTVSCLESQGKLPSQTEPNPRHNVNAITLRSGKVLKPVPDTSRGHDTSQDKEKLDTRASVESAPQKTFTIPPLFPGRLVQCKKE